MTEHQHEDFTLFESDDVTLSAMEAEHAIIHYHELRARADGAEHKDAALNGIMAACIAHALRWDVAKGYIMCEGSEPFQTLVLVLRDVYADCLRQGAFTGGITAAELS